MYFFICLLLIVIKKIIVILAYCWSTLMDRLYFADLITGWWSNNSLEIIASVVKYGWIITFLWQRGILFISGPLYPFGAGDTMSSRSDDGSSPLIPLSRPFVYFGNTYHQIYVGRNVHLLISVAWNLLCILNIFVGKTVCNALWLLLLVRLNIGCKKSRCHCLPGCNLVLWCLFNQ